MGLDDKNICGEVNPINIEIKHCKNIVSAQLNLVVGLSCYKNIRMMEFVA